MSKVDRNTAITAMCLYEYYVDSPGRPFAKALDSYRTSSGSFLMRDKVLTLACKIEDAFSALDDALHNHDINLGDALHEGDFMSWDFDSLPHLADIYGPRFFRNEPINHNELVEELLRMAKLEHFSGIATLEP